VLLDPGELRRRSSPESVRRGSCEPFGRGLAVDRELHRLAGQPGESPPRSLGCVEGTPVHREDVVAGLDLQSGLEQGGPHLAVPGRALDDLLDPVGAVRHFPIDAEIAGLDQGRLLASPLTACEMR
jgi:hypothetical protein